MKNWFKNMSKEKWQKVIFFGLLGVLFIVFFVSLQFVETPSLGEGEEPDAEDPSGETNIPNSPVEKFIAPTKSSYKIVRTYFNSELEVSELESALMEYETGKYINSIGISLSIEGSKNFEVVATLSGKVIDVSEDSLYGKVVVIEHSDGFTSEYSSLSEVSVKEGDTIKQGDKIGLSGECLVDNAISDHVYFIVRHNKETINPTLVFGKTIAEIK